MGFVSTWAVLVFCGASSLPSSAARPRVTSKTRTSPTLGCVKFDNNRRRFFGGVPGNECPDNYVKPGRRRSDPHSTETGCCVKCFAPMNQNCSSDPGECDNASFQRCASCGVCDHGTCKPSALQAGDHISTTDSIIMDKGGPEGVKSAERIPQGSFGYVVIITRDCDADIWWNKLSENAPPGKAVPDLVWQSRFQYLKVEDCQSMNTSATCAQCQGYAWTGSRCQPLYKMEAPGRGECRELGGIKITDVETCKAATEALHKIWHADNGIKNHSDIPHGCYAVATKQGNALVFFNPYNQEKMTLKQFSYTRQICKVNASSATSHPTTVQANPMVSTVGMKNAEDAQVPMEIPQRLFVAHAHTHASDGEYFLEQGTTHGGRSVWHHVGVPERWLFYSTKASSWFISERIEDQGWYSARSSANSPVGLPWLYNNSSPIVVSEGPASFGATQPRSSTASHLTSSTASAASAASFTKLGDGACRDEHGKKPNVYGKDGMTEDQCGNQCKSAAFCLGFLIYTSGHFNQRCWIYDPSVQNGPAGWPLFETGAERNGELTAVDKAICGSSTCTCFKLIKK